jgi:spore coat protein JB
MNERERLMKEVMEYAFAAHEWNLYLDTHPKDRMALELFRRMVDKAQELKKAYVEKFGPITAWDADDTQEWTWISEPWPWNN